MKQRLSYDVVWNRTFATDFLSHHPVINHKPISAWLPKRVLALWVLTLVLASPVSSLHAQADNYSVQANIIYHFTKYIDWPPAQKTGDFIIGVTGDSPLYQELKKTMVNKTVGSQKIVVTKISASSSTFNCQILFISDDESPGIRKIASRTQDTGTLLVSESNGLAQKGSCINFSIVSDRLKLEINKNNIEQRNLSIASELLKLGKVVK